MKLYQIFRYGLMRRVKRLQNKLTSSKGGRLHIALTFRCNLSCPYCVNHLQEGRKPKTAEKPFEYWKDYILSWTEPLNEIKITGGSPEAHPDFIKIINWILSRGTCVTIYTNLHYFKQLNSLRPSPKLMLVATYHHCMDRYEFEVNYFMLREKYRIDVKEIDDSDEFLGSYHPTAIEKYKGSSKLLSYSRLTPLETQDEHQASKNQTKMLRVGPSGKVYLTCYETFIDD